MDVCNQEAVGAFEEKPLNRNEVISKIIFKDFDFLESCKSATTDQFLSAAAQLCHMDSNLAEQVWLQNFPKLWAILDGRQRNVRAFVVFSFVLTLALFRF